MLPEGCRNRATESEQRPSGSIADSPAPEGALEPAHTWLSCSGWSLTYARLDGQAPQSPERQEPTFEVPLRVGEAASQAKGVSDPKRSLAIQSKARSALGDSHSIRRYWPDVKRAKIGVDHVGEGRLNPESNSEPPNDGRYRPNSCPLDEPL